MHTHWNPRKASATSQPAHPAPIRRNCSTSTALYDICAHHHDHVLTTAPFPPHRREGVRPPSQHQSLPHLSQCRVTLSQRLPASPSPLSQICRGLTLKLPVPCYRRIPTAPPLPPPLPLLVPVYIHTCCELGMLHLLSLWGMCRHKLPTAVERGNLAAVQGTRRALACTASSAHQDMGLELSRS